MLLLATRTGCVAWLGLRKAYAEGAAPRARMAQAGATASRPQRAPPAPRAGGAMAHAGGDVSHPPSKMKKIYDQNDAASD